MDKTVKNGEEVAKEALWLAWQASTVLGMGFLQDRPNATKEDVWNCMKQDGKVNADYVFGRMMKLYFTYGEDWVSYHDETPRLDYQSWCCKYSTYDDLFEKAISNLEE